MSRSNAKTTDSQNKDPWQELPFDPWLIVATVRRNWPWAASLGTLLALLATTYVYRSFVPEYLASYLFEANRDFVVFQGVMQAPADLNLVLNERPLMENHLVLAPVLSDPKVCQAPSLQDVNSREMNLRRHMSISDLGSRSLMRLSYRDTDPVAAATVCNAIAKSYLQQRQRFDDRRISDLEGWLQPALKLWQDEVEQHRERIVKLSKQARGFDPFQETTRLNADTTYLTHLRDELSELRSTESVLEAELLMLKDSKNLADQSFKNDIDPLELDEMIDEHDEVLRITELLEEKNAEMRMMESSDLVRTRQSWYEGLKSDSAKLESELSLAKEAAIPEVLAIWRESTVVKKAAELSRTRTRREVIESNYEAEEDRLSNFAGETAELYFAQQKYLQARNILERLHERTASLRTERQKSSTIQTLAEATPPTVPIESVPWKKIFLYAVGSFLAPFGIAFIWELQSKRIAYSEALGTVKEIPVLGEVAKLPSRSVSSWKQRAYDESIESLKTNFLFTRPANAKILVVASSMPREGKSTLASHLALSLSRAGSRPVLLIDADMRSPDQHHLFDLDLNIGLAEVLVGIAPLNDAINRSLGEHLHVLTAGKTRKDLYRNLTQERIQEVLHEAREQYQYIVIDTAPILAASESLTFASVADGTLLCTMRDVSRQDHLQRCVQRLALSGARIIGMVFSGIPMRQYYYRYGDYRYTDTSDVASTSVESEHA